MKQLFLIFTLIFTGLAQDKSTEIVNLTLNPRITHTIGITANDLGVTTLVFPGPLESVQPAKVDIVSEGSGNKKVIQPFVMAHTKGSYYLTIKSHANVGAVGALNVIFRRQVYVIKLKSIKQGLSSVNFVMPKTPVVATKNVVTAEKLISAIDKAKAYYQLQKHYPEEAKLIPTKVYNQAYSYKTHDLTLLRGYRFTGLDAIVFEIVISNKTKSQLRYNPKDILINLGKNFFPAALVDASGHVPPGTKSTAYVVISGHPLGGRNNLSLNNDFAPIINIYEITSPKVVSATVKEPKEEPAKPERHIRTIRKLKVKE